MAALFKDWTPLLNSTLEASQSINRTAPILACTQVLMILILAAIFTALFGLLITLNPDLDAERQQFVTPAVRFLLNQTVNCGCIAAKISAWPLTAAWALLSGTSPTAENSPVASGKEKSGRGRGSNKTS